MKDTIFDNDYWITKTGKTIKPQDFSDSHLINVIEFIERGGDNDYLHNIYLLDILNTSHPSQEVFNTMGDIAQLAMEKEIDLSYLDWLKTQKLYNLLIEEEQRRTKKIMRKIMKRRDDKYGEC